jgi:hypothetical protein
MLPETITHHVSAIYNAAWFVRFYARGGRVAIQQKQRKKAIQDMGLVIRKAFNASDDFEPLLTAVADGLSQKNDPPF